MSEFTPFHLSWERNKQHFDLVSPFNSQSDLFDQWAIEKENTCKHLIWSVLNKCIKCKEKKICGKTEWSGLTMRLLHAYLSAILVAMQFLVSCWGTNIHRLATQEGNQIQFCLWVTSFMFCFILLFICLFFVFLLLSHEKEKFEAQMQKITFTYLFFLDNLNAFQPIPCEHLQETLTTNNLISSCNSKIFLYSVQEVFKESSDTFPFFYYFQIFFSFLTNGFF